MAGGTTAPTGSNLTTYNGRSRRTKPTLERTKGVSYNATTSDQIFSISASASATTKEAMPSMVEVENNGRVPVMLMTGYETYSSDTADDVTEYLHQMLLPGEVYSPPVRAVIRTGESTVIMDGTAVDNAAPNSNEYENVSAYIDGAGLASGTTATTFDVDNNAGSPAAAVGFFRIGDKIRIEDETLEITAIAANTGSEAQLTVIRGVDGSTAATHADNTQIRLPFYNAYHDFDKYTVAQTDSQGRFKAFNFFGLGRANSAVQGITPGSCAFKFYQEGGFQELGLDGVTSSTNSGLTASTAYQFTIAVDGGSAYDLDFTTDSSNLNWGGTNGILDKLNTVFKTAFYTDGNLFEKDISVGIVGGDIRFTSHSNLSTTAISLGDSSGGDTDWWGVGRIPAVGSVDAAVASKVPDDVIYDRVTYTASPNTGVFLYDDGKGNLFGNGSGTINYETGAIDMVGCPPNAEFVISCTHTSAFSGKLTESETDRINSLVDIYANTPSQKWNGSVKVRTY